MAIFIKNDEQINYMRMAGRIVAQTHELLKKEIREGMTTKELDSIADDFIRSSGAIPSFKNYGGFPASICTSVNDEVIHGIPSLRKLKNGDIISIDIGALIHGFHGDAARTHVVGNATEQVVKLIDVTEKSFFEGVQYARSGFHLFQISAAVQEVAENYGFSVVREYVGHGIGKQLHEEPQIPNYRQPSRGPRLSKGMVLAIEPMVNAGSHEIKTLEDGWTVVTKDGQFSAHYENTVFITDGEPEFLTLL